MYRLADQLARIVRRAKCVDNAWSRIVELEPKLSRYQQRFTRLFDNPTRVSKVRSWKFWLNLLREAAAFHAAKNRDDGTCVATEEFIHSNAVDKRHLAGKPVRSRSEAHERRIKQLALVKSHSAVLNSYIHDPLYICLALTLTVPLSEKANALEQIRDFFYRLVCKFPTVMVSGRFELTKLGVEHFHCTLISKVDLIEAVCSYVESSFGRVDSQKRSRVCIRPVNNPEGWSWYIHKNYESVNEKVRRRSLGKRKFGINRNFKENTETSVVEFQPKTPFFKVGYLLIKCKETQIGKISAGSVPSTEATEHHREEDSCISSIIGRIFLYSTPPPEPKCQSPPCAIAQEDARPRIYVAVTGQLRVLNRTTGAMAPIPIHKIT